MRRTRRARRATTNPRRRSSYRKNAYVPLALNRPRRRRRVRPYVQGSGRVRRLKMNPQGRRRYRRNPPDILGFNLKDMAMAGAAVIFAPFVEKQIQGILPASMAGTATGRWAVKVGAALGTGYAAKKLLGPKAGNLALIALGANLISDAVTEFAPSLTGLGYYSQRPGLGYFRSSGMLGMGSSAMGPFVGIDGRASIPMSVSTDPFKPSF